MKEYIIIGAGGFGRETAWLVQQAGGVIRGFLDDGYGEGDTVGGYTVLGRTEEVGKFQISNFIVAIADPATRRRLVSSLKLAGRECPSVFHPKASCGSPGNQWGSGCIITEGVIMTTGIMLGDWVIVNLATTIGHDVKIGSYCSIMPQCSISGNVTLGEGCYIGAGVRILQGVTLGDGCVVGAGAVVTKSYPANSKLVGVPAHPQTS
ncbi:MAG: acetyltransferase [Bacteroidetes bacterium]|nr:acetyltransferase [Bacteroidota bacterium]